MNKKICILLLCGLPGAGKTTFVQHLQKFLSEQCDNSRQNGAVKSEPIPSHLTSVISKHVCFDAIITEHVYPDSTAKGSPDNESAWKSQRKYILCLLERDLCELANGAWAAPEHAVPLDLLTKYSALQWLPHSPSGAKDDLCVFLIDDNMFYKSMRYEYFQLARKYNTGFSQVYIKCSVEEALARNRLRETCVPDDVIVNMATRLEPPDREAHWEEISVTLSSGTCCHEENLHLVLDIINTAVANPVQSLPLVDSAESAEDRVICSNNIIHQADQVFRKLVGQEMAQVKGDKQFMRKRASQLNTLRSTVLEEMKIGILRIPASLEDQVTDAFKDKQNELNKFLRRLYMNRLLQE